MAEVVSLCGEIGANTGRIKCDIARGVPKFPLLGGAVIDKADLATQALFKAALKEAIELATGSSGKLFPLPEVQNVTNNTEAPSTGTLGLGFTFELRAGRPTYVLGFLMGINQEVKIKAFHNETVPLIIIDDKRNAWGVETADGDFRGADVQVSVTSRPFQDGNTAEAVLTQVTLSYLNVDDFDYPAVVKTDLKAGDLEGLLDVQLVYESHASNVFTYALMVDTVDLSNPLTLPAATLAAITASLLYAKTGVAQTGTLAITSSAIVAGKLAVTYDSTAYAALATGTPIGLYFDPPSDLSAAGIVGIEVHPDITNKPA